MPTNSTKTSWTVRWAAYGAIALALYVAVALVWFALSMALLSKGIFPANKVFREYQRAMYIGGLRRIWQCEPDCLDFDPVVLYKPKLGQCHFDNVEFKTVLNFDRYGRYSGPKPNKTGIAVIGDSHAMGWGVQDGETFSYLLEHKLGRPVYNLAVSSYGTYRELQRLQQSGLFGKVDTVIIVYSDNDIVENIEKLASPTPPTQAQYDAMMASIHQGVGTTLKEWFKIAFKKPIKVALRSVVPEDPSYDFAPHYEQILKVFEKFSWVKQKKVYLFYSNDAGRKFTNFDQVTAPSKGGPVTFVDLDLGSAYYYPIDGHPTKLGHAKMAEKIAGWFGK